MKTLAHKGVLYIGGIPGRWGSASGGKFKIGFDMFTIKDDVEPIPHQDLGQGVRMSVQQSEVECGDVIGRGTRSNQLLQLNTQTRAHSPSHPAAHQLESYGCDAAEDRNRGE